MDPERDEVAIRPEPVPRVYTNAMAAHGGPFDLTLEFAYRRRAEDEAEPQIYVTMSWEHVLAMLKSLQVLVDGYQAEVGSIPDLARVREGESE